MLPRSSRLRGAREFREIHERGIRVGENFLVVHLLANVGSHLVARVGFTVSKKVGIAVVRNRVRRRLREAFRAIAPEIIQGVSLVVSARATASGATYTELATSLHLALRRLNLLRRVPPTKDLTLDLLAMGAGETSP